jgi:nucleotide-binding universal stress UspA family protein
MTFKDLLVHVDATDFAEKRLRVAIDLAGRYGARLTGLYAETVSIGSSIVGRRDPDQVAKAVARAKDLFLTKAGAAGIPSAWWAVEARENAELTDWTVQAARYVDLAIFGGPTGDEGDRLPEDLVEELCIEAGRPILAIPPRVPVGRVGDSVLVAWTGSRSSARAVNDALPILARAKEVTVISIQLPGAKTSAGAMPPLDVAAHLAAHGIQARQERFIIGELGMVDHVLNRTMDLGADLIVMGAHGTRGLPRPRSEDHTAEILRSMTAPLLLSH